MSRNLQKDEISITEKQSEQENEFTIRHFPMNATTSPNNQFFSRPFLGRFDL